MSDLSIKDIKPEQAKEMDFNDYDISLKLDGTLIYFIDGKLISPRCERSERFKHILNILIKDNFPNCVGEIFLDVKGSCVFDVSKKENWGKVKFMPFELIGQDNFLSYSQRQQVLSVRVKMLENSFIVPMKKFYTFKEGWNYVLENQSEGLVIRNNHNWYKCKLLQEVKEEIISHQSGEVKGTFVLKSGNRVSGTSIRFITQYLDIKKEGKKAIAEIETPFITKDGKYFQSRLRRIYKEE